MRQRALSGLPSITAPFSFPADIVTIRVTFTLVDTDFPEKVLVVGFDLTEDETSSTNLKPEKL